MKTATGGAKSPEGFDMVVDIVPNITISIDPLTFVLHPIATFEVDRRNESLITFVFVHLSAFAWGIVPR